ncbi:MAG: hypothetical protein ABFS41_05630 [Myxococcota bacterium]
MRRRRWIPLLALALSGSACASLDGWRRPLADARPEARPGPAADVVIDARDPGSGELQIEMAIAGLRAERFVWRGSLDEVALTSPAFWGADGRRIAAVRERDGFRLERAPGPVVRVRYRAKPGGRGRHGRQGIVTSEFASLDGRIFILPADAAGLRDARIRVRLPEGWRVASPFREQGEEHHVGPELVADALAGSCFALGPFERTSRTLGQTEFRVFTHQLWSEAYRARLTDKTFGIFSWFQRELGFDPGVPYAAVWTPDVDGERVFGGSYANGTCMEHPTERVRNFELLAHRIGHAVNGYPTTGMQLRDPADSWFREGWASYVELAAIQGSGVTADASRWERLYRRYLRERVRHPERDLPLAHEPRARGSSVEFLHYVKGPLVVAMLADWIRTHSETTLEAFMRAMWSAHGRYRSPLALREELAAFTGLDLAPFWRRMVDARSQVIPVWQESQATGAPPVATAGGHPVSLAYLLLLARSGEFSLYHEIEAFLRAEAQARAAVAGWSGYPAFGDEPAALAPARRHALARHAIEVAALRAPREPTEPPGLRLTPDHPAAKTFVTLLEKERAYLAALGQHGVGGIALRAPGAPPALVVAPEQPLMLLTDWLWSPREPRAVALEGGGAKTSLPVQGAHPKGQSRSIFTAAARPAGEVIEFELRDGDRVLARRAFWQHALAAPTGDE